MQRADRAVIGQAQWAHGSGYRTAVSARLQLSRAAAKLPDLPPRRLTSEAVASYAGQALSPDPGDYTIPPKLIVDRADELLDAQATLRDYGALGEPLAFEGGSHRFEHMAEALGPIQNCLFHR